MQDACGSETQYRSFIYNSMREFFSGNNNVFYYYRRRPSQKIGEQIWKNYRI